MNSATVANLKNELKAIKARLKVLDAQGGRSQDLSTAAKREWSRLLAQGKLLKASIAEAEAAAIDASLRRTPAEREIGAVVRKAVGKRTSKPTATSAVHAVIQQSRSKVGRR
jgi:hypothetical protein